MMLFSFSVSSVFQRAVAAAADIVWPPSCILCKRYCREAVCKECRMRSRLFEGGSAFAGAQCTESSCAPACSGIYAAGVYAAAFKAALLEYKFQGQLWMGKSFGELMYQMLSENGAFDDCEFITYVPISDKRFAERGFDQSEVVARDIAERAGIRCERLLVRATQGTAQSKFNRKERFENSVNRFNLSDEFAANCKGLGNRKLILIDDILTTGATLQECASLLKESGWEYIIGAVIATGRKDI